MERKNERDAVETAVTPEMSEALITPEMIEAGLSTLYDFHITEPDDEEMREAVRAVFIAMMKVRH